MGGIGICVKAFLAALLLDIGTSHHLGLVAVQDVPGDPDFRTILASGCLGTRVRLALFLILYDINLVLL